MSKLYNYDGVEYNIKSIIGVFDRNVQTKDIVLNASKFYQVDLKGRRVNAKGYLLDK